MSCLPSKPNRISPLGVAAAEQDYQHLCSSRVRRMCVSGAALLLSAFTHAILIAAFIASLDQAAAVRYAAAFIGVLPITYFLARIYTHSRAEVRQARVWMAEIRANRRPIGF
jgi:hypothetical protein